MSKCEKCGAEFEPKDLLSGFCTDCIFKMATERRAITKDDIKKAKMLVEAETAGLIAPDLLDGILDSLMDAVLEGEDRDDVRTRARVEIQRLAGLGCCREMLKTSEALSETSRQIEEEIRRKIAALARMKP